MAVNKSQSVKSQLVGRLDGINFEGKSAKEIIKAVATSGAQYVLGRAVGVQSGSGFQSSKLHGGDASAVSSAIYARKDRYEVLADVVDGMCTNSNPTVFAKACEVLAGPVKEACRQVRGNHD